MIVAPQIVVFERGAPGSGQGHVGIILGRDAAGNLVVISGNADNMVCIKSFSRKRVLGYRWPGIYPFPERFNLPLLTSSGVSVNEA